MSLMLLVISSQKQGSWHLGLVPSLISSRTSNVRPPIPHERYARDRRPNSGDATETETAAISRARGLRGGAVRVVCVAATCESMGGEDIHQARARIRQDTGICFADIGRRVMMSPSMRSSACSINATVVLFWLLLNEDKSPSIAL